MDHTGGTLPLPGQGQSPVQQLGTQHVTQRTHEGELGQALVVNATRKGHVPVLGAVAVHLGWGFQGVRSVRGVHVFERSCTSPWSSSSASEWRGPGLKSEKMEEVISVVVVLVVVVAAVIVIFCCCQGFREV